jgi:hypothetical protein
MIVQHIVDCVVSSAVLVVVNVMFRLHEPCLHSVAIFTHSYACLNGTAAAAVVLYAMKQSDAFLTQVLQVNETLMQNANGSTNNKTAAVATATGTGKSATGSKLKRKKKVVRSKQQQQQQQQPSPPLQMHNGSSSTVIEQQQQQQQQAKREAFLKARTGTGGTATTAATARTAASASDAFGATVGSSQHQQQPQSQQQRRKQRAVDAAVYNVGTHSARRARTTSAATATANSVPQTRLAAASKRVIVRTNGRKLVAPKNVKRGNSDGGANGVEEPPFVPPGVGGYDSSYNVSAAVSSALKAARRIAPGLPLDKVSQRFDNDCLHFIVAIVVLLLLSWCHDYNGTVCYLLVLSSACSTHECQILPPRRLTASGWF